MNTSDIKSFPILATALDGERVVAKATNRRGSLWVSLHSIHAEEFLIRKLRKLKARERFKNLRVLVERYDKAGNPRLALPCRKCHSLLQRYGIHYVAFTTDYGAASIYM